MGQLFERFFPGREDVIRLLMEPITYANGSTLEDPGHLLRHRVLELHVQGRVHLPGRNRPADRPDARRAAASGVDVRIRCDVEQILVSGGRVTRRPGQRPHDQPPGGRLQRQSARPPSSTWSESEHFDRDFVEQARAVRLNNSSSQVYMALQAGRVARRRACGDLLFSSTAPLFRTELLLSRNVTSRTYSFYYPRDPARQRPLADRLQHQRQLRAIGPTFRRRNTRPANAT